LSVLTASFDGQELLYYVELSSAGKGKKFGGCLVQQRRQRSISLMLGECRKQIHMQAKWSTPNEAFIKTAVCELCSSCCTSQCLQEVTQQSGRAEENSLCHFPTCDFRDACNTAAHSLKLAGLS